MATFLLFLNLLLPGYFSQPQDGKANEDAKGFLQRWCTAWKSNKVDSMLTFYDKSEDVVAVMSSGKVCRGSKGLREMYFSAFEELVFEKVTFQDLQLKKEGNVAWGHGRFLADTVVRETGVRWRLQVQATLVLRRDDIGWKIVMEHFSSIPDTPRIGPRN